ncbi:MAG: Xylose isomerase-like barrel, partial [Sedimentibacter sp.]|nr:Xylose isomerase-like barrel [Sedimentibacter sp.]
SDVDLIEWIEVLGPLIGHVHLHNNDKTYDCHWPLGNGSMNMNKIMEAFKKNSTEDITFTVENQECRESIEWLVKNGWITK